MWHIKFSNLVKLTLKSKYTFGNGYDNSKYIDSGWWGVENSGIYCIEGHGTYEVDIADKVEKFNGSFIK